jgi:spoIIIJ-associated protein
MDRRSSVDIQARSRDEALRLALEQLGARSEDVTVEVLAEIENDFYGDGEVLLRVTRKGAQPPPSTAATVRQTVSDEDLEEYEQLAKEIVVELLDMMAVEADVMAVDNPSVMPVGADDPPTVFIDVMGRDLGLLIGRQVARHRRAIALEPMPPNERRIVHLTLQNQPDVSTESSGDEPQRRVTVLPS